MLRAKILVVSELFWPDGGGAEYATYLILQMLRRHGYEITVLTGTSKPASIPGIRFYYTPLLRALNRVALRFRLITLTKEGLFQKLLNQHDALYIPEATYPLIPLAKKKDLHVIVHMHNYMFVRYHGVKYFFEEDRLNICKEFKIGILHEAYMQRSIVRTMFMPISYVFYKHDQQWLERVDKLICVSRRQAEIVLKQLPMLRNRIKVVYNPPPPELINDKPVKELDNMPTFIYVGGDSYVKGFHILLQAMRQLGKRGIKVRFVLANKYSTKNLLALKLLSKKYRSLEIAVVGKVEYSKLLELYRKAWAFIFPSISEEPLPYSVIEAILTGTMPIASKVGGIPEILEGTPAEKFLFNPGNVDEFVSKLEEPTSMDRIELLRLGEKLRDLILLKLRNSATNLVKVFGL